MIKIHGWLFIPGGLNHYKVITERVSVTTTSYHRPTARFVFMLFQACLVSAGTCIWACSSAHDDLTCPPSSDSISYKDGGASSDGSTSKGWVENDDGKGGKLVQVKWRWENPLPQGNRLNDIWRFNENDIYAVGDHGTILHFDGNAWHAMESGTANDLFGVAGCEGQLFSVGAQGTVLKMNQGVWQKLTPPPPISHWLYGVCCQSAKDIYIVGANRTFLHFNGSAWSTIEWAYQTPPNGYTIEEMNQRSITLYAVQGANNQIFAGGENQTLIRFDPSSNKAEVTYIDLYQCANCIVKDLWSPDGANISALAYSPYLGRDSILLTYYAGEIALSHSFGPTRMFSISGSSANDITVVGEKGQVLHYNGSDWNELNTITSTHLAQIISLEPHRYMAIGDSGTILAIDNQTITKVSGGETADLQSITSTDDQRLIAAGENGTTLVKNNGAWSKMQTSSEHAINALWSIGATTFAVGEQGSILIFDGQFWTKMSSGITTPLRAVWGSSDNNIFAVGDEGTILRYDGGGWSKMSSGVSVDLTAIFGTDPHQIFAAGEQQTILSFDGESWNSFQSKGTKTLKSIWGTTANHLYLAGGDTIFHYDGSSLMPVIQGFPCELLSLSGKNDTRIAATSACGKILLYQGSTTWISIASPTSARLNSLAMIDDTRGLVAGDNGAILGFQLPPNP